MKRISAAALILIGTFALQPGMALAYGAGVPGLGQVLGISTGNSCRVSAADRQASDYIPFNQAPSVVKRSFGEVFGRTISRTESGYWKQRARCDKATVSKLKDAMLWHTSVGSFGPKLDKAGKAAVLKSRLNEIFNNVYGRGPTVSEVRYWTSRIMDTLSLPALRNTMLFHLWNGLVH